MDGEEKSDVIDVDEEMHDDDDFVKTLEQSDGNKPKRVSGHF